MSIGSISLNNIIIGRRQIEVTAGACQRWWRNLYGTEVAPVMAKWSSQLRYSVGEASCRFTQVETADFRQRLRRCGSPQLGFRRWNQLQSSETASRHCGEVMFSLEFWIKLEFKLGFSSLHSFPRNACFYVPLASFGKQVTRTQVLFLRERLCRAHRTLYK